MKNILYPTDFSENSTHALDYAVELARLFDAELMLFNSYELPYSRSNVLVSMTERMQKDSEESLKEMQSRVLKNKKYAHLKVSIESQSGGFVSLIPKVAKRFKSDLIVMGTKGASGIKEVFIGSNTLEVIQVAHCPVLAIPEKAAIAQERKFDNIAMATDLRPLVKDSILNPLFSIAKQCKSSLEFVHIIRNEEENELDSNTKRAIELEGLAGSIPNSIHFATNEDIIDGLSDYINDKEPDLFAMISRKHSLFERIFTKSITNKLSFRTEVPLLVLSE
jgi:nucleotide-binding universal stress UspA family protein